VRVGAEREVPARFTLLQSASVARRAIVVVVGPVLWVVALVVVGVVVDQRQAVEFGLIVTLVAFVLSLSVSALARRRRLREERDAEAL
jgi:hypothetical protein